MNERGREPSWWKRPWAPGPLRPTLGVYALLLVPAGLGAAFDWSMWLTLALLTPAILLSIRIGEAGAQQRGLRSHKETPWVANGVIGGMGAVVLVLLIDIVDERYVGVLIAGMATTLDLIMRAWWLHYDRRRAALRPNRGSGS